jgi:hypothetical protein
VKRLAEQRPLDARPLHGRWEDRRINRGRRSAGEARGKSQRGTGDMKEPGLRRDIMREWVAPAEDKRQAEDHMQRVANAFFLGVTIFALAFAYFVLSARAQDHHHRAMRNSMSFSTAVLSENFIRPQFAP